MENWTIIITSPLGETRAALTLVETDGALTGEMRGKGGAGPVEDGHVDGDRLTWTCRIQKPAPMALRFSGRRTDEAITGKVKFGLFASGTFAATPA